MTESLGGQIPSSMRRNHWMNQVAGHAVARPESTALRFKGSTTTWSDLQDRVTRFASGLSDLGVGFGDRVLLLTFNSPSVVEAVLAVNTLGAIAVPVNIRLAPAEIAYIVDNADGDVIVADRPLVPLLAPVAQLSDRIRSVIVLGEAEPGDEEREWLASEQLLRQAATPFVGPDVPEDSPALIMYTSGTTGRPKGAVLDHGNLFAQSVTNIRAMGMIDENDVGFLTAPLFHIAGLAGIAPNIVLGVPTVLHPLGGFDASETLDAWETEKATIVFNVPTQWQAVCEEPTVKERNLALRVISWGAAPASETLLEQMAECFPNAVNIAVFGQTEMSPVTCVLRKEDSIRKLGSVGQPIPTIQSRVVDDDMNDVAVGEVGEIVYRGPTLMQGYWRKPEATAEAFAGGWFHSGDLVRQDDEGFTWVIDRKKDMIISGGENIYCAEVENVLFAHPDIVEAAVYGRSDEKWGDIPIAAVVLRAGSSLSVAALSEWLHDRLARFKHPKDLVMLDELPRNASGKVVKAVLRDGDPA